MVLFVFGTDIYAYAEQKQATSKQQSDVQIAENLNDFGSFDFVNESTDESFELTATKIKSTSVVLRWQSDSLYISYKICKYNVINDEWEEIDTTTYTSYKLKGLTPSTDYEFCVKSSVTDTVLGTISLTTKKKLVKKTVKMGLPSVSGSTKTYAYYTAVTAKSSPQYKLLNSSKCHTDPKTGIRMVGDYYCIALGSYYGSTIGTKYKITLSTGKSFKAILCDQKANRHTDSNNQYAVRNKDIVEFYVEKSKIPSCVNGDYSALSQFKGSIVSIEKYV